MSESSNSLENNNPPEKINSFEKILCLIAYVFGIPGVLFVRFKGKKSSLCLHHVRRSLELIFFMVFLFISWFIITYILMYIPYGGFPIAMALFGVVITAGIFSLVLAVMGIAKGFRGKAVVFPFVTSVMSKIEPVFRFLGLPEEMP